MGVNGRVLPFDVANPSETHTSNSSRIYTLVGRAFGTIGVNESEGRGIEMAQSPTRWCVGDVGEEALADGWLAG